MATTDKTAARRQAEHTSKLLARWGERANEWMLAGKRNKDR